MVVDHVFDIGAWYRPSNLKLSKKKKKHKPKIIMSKGRFPNFSSHWRLTTLIEDFRLKLTIITWLQT